ncbi:hypothetical protein Ddc_19167 [Ditylenchus destructor]|nr:hypothetical protein Ddc_19167 [Ditylenchus destructor]
MPHGSPDEAFCKALEGKYDVFAKAYFQHRDNPEIDPCQVAQICGPSFNHLASLSHVFALSEETSACQRCTEIVTKLDHYLISTPEEMAKALQKRCLLEGQSSSNKQFCKAIQGKYDVFAKAYFQHRDNPEVDPCKVAGICTAKSVGLNNLASLSQDFALSNACEDCNYFVAFADKSPQMPKDQNTPEKLAKVLQDTCEPPKAELCKALEGKFLVFAKAYFQHRDDPQVDPCKVAQVC